MVFEAKDIGLLVAGLLGGGEIVGHYISIVTLPIIETWARFGYECGRR